MVEEEDNKTTKAAPVAVPPAKKKARTEAPGPLTCEESEFGTLDDGRVVTRYDLSNGSMAVSLVR